MTADQARIKALEAENERLRKMAYIYIPLPRGLRWLSRFSATPNQTNLRGGT